VPNMSLSEEDFNRLQSQILDLRNANYELKDKLNRQSNENSSLKEIIQRQKGDLLKNKVQGSLLNTIKNNPLKRQDDGLVQERDQLQQKLHQQEEEFRLQNDTLIWELDRLQAHNSELEAQLIVEKDDSSNSNDAEVIRLQAENAALFKKLQAGVFLAYLHINFKCSSFVV
jgi:predicted nuclease with TOPRIM domain